MTRSLKIGSWNVCNGIAMKMDYVKNALTEYDLDVLFIQEAEISETLQKDLYNIQGYTIEMCATTSENKIRMICYIRDNINYERRIERDNNNVMMLQIEEIYQVQQVVGIYRAFKIEDGLGLHDRMRDMVREMSDFIEENKTCVILGDLNLDFAKKNSPDYRQRAIYDEWLEMVDAFDLRQTVEEVTWERIHANEVRTSILDHIYTNNQEVVSQVRVEKQEISDHSLVLIETEGRTDRNKKYKTINYQNWRKYSKENLLSVLRRENLNYNPEATAQQVCDMLDKLLGKAVDELIPVEERKIGLNETIPSHIQAKKRKMRNLHKRAKRTRNLDLMKKCRTIEREIKKELQQSKRTKIRKEAELGGKNLWKAVRIAQDKPVEGLPDEIKLRNGMKIGGNFEQAEEFSKYFEEKTREVVASTNIEEETVYNGRRKINGNYEEDWIRMEKVSEIMNNLPAKRCFGYDRVPLIFLKDGAEVLAPIVTDLMKKIFKEKRAPEQWKIARIVPLHKKGKKEEITNYRPISNLCSLSKVYERLILMRVEEIEETEGIDITGESQYGFKKRCGTETACLEIQSRLAAICDGSKYATMSSLDLSAAFDVVNRPLLIRRLRIMGIPENIVLLIKDWLTDRLAYCEVGGVTSMMRNIDEGTIQGSILGPLLFAIFVSPLWDVVEATTFADDNYIISEGQNIEESLENCKATTEQAIKWFKNSGLCVNEQKTEVCLFNRNDVGRHWMELNGINIEVRKQIKVLGLIFDTKLTWFAQVMAAIEKANRVKQGLRMVNRFFTKDEMVRLSTSLFYSRLYYGAKVWLHTGLSAVAKKKLWQTSSRMLKIVQKDWNGEKSFKELHKVSKRATPEMWSNYVHCCALFDVVTIGKPNILLCKLMENNMVEQRFQGLIFTKSNRLKIGSNCLSNRVSNVSRKLNYNWIMYTKTAFKMNCKKLMINDVLER